MSSSSIVLTSSRSIGDKYAHWICMFVCVCVWTKSYTFYSVFARIMHISKPATKMSIVQEFFFDRQRPRWQLLPFKLRHLVTTAEILDNAEIEMEIFRLEHELLADTAQYVVSNGNHCARRFRAILRVCGVTLQVVILLMVSIDRFEATLFKYNQTVNLLELVPASHVWAIFFICSYQSKFRRHMNALQLAENPPKTGSIWASRSLTHDSKKKKLVDASSACNPFNIIHNTFYRNSLVSVCVGLCVWMCESMCLCERISTSIETCHRIYALEYSELWLAKHFPLPISVCRWWCC